MAAPNIAGLTTLTGKSAGASLTTSLADVVANAAASSKVFKINTITAANTSTTLTVSVDIGWNNGTTTFYIAKNVSIPPDASLFVLDKNNQLYLEENTSIKAKASGGGLINLVVSYEEIS